MALDLNLFNDFETDGSNSTLRIYSWRPNCISLGYAQKVERLIGGKAARRLGWDVVKRPTGGGIVFHNEAEVTYSLVTGVDNPLLPKGLIQSYKKISEAVIFALQKIGIDAEILPTRDLRPATRDPLCFSYPAEYEVVASGRKIVGSAQKRGKRALLQQGSIFVRRTPAELFSLLKKPHAGYNAVSVEEVLGREVGFEEMAEAMINGFKRVFIAFSILLLSFPCWAATWLDPSLKWKTIETPHFSINYYAEIEDVAKRFAPIAEEVYATMTKVMKYKIDMKTQVTLLDTTDYGNGYTMLFPYPAITLYLSDLSGNLNPYKYDNYLRYLFLHEYTHALHLDIAEGGASIFRAIFGRLIFPNALEPWFLTEGLATYMETRYTGAGRGRDPRWEMMLRMDVLEDNLKSIDQAAVNTVRWPMGHLRYLYGVNFLEYLSKTYGEGNLISLAHIYGDYLFSYGIDGAFVALYKKNLSMLWNEWVDFLREKYQKQKAGMKNITEPKLVTGGGYYNLKPKWSGDSRSIYFSQRGADDYPQIRRLDVSSGQSEKILEGIVSDDNFTIGDGGRTLYYSKVDTHNNYYYYKDVYSLDIESRRPKRLTEGARAADPAVSPDGKRLIYVRNEKGTRALVGLPVSSEAGVQYFSPAFSPDGKAIAVAKHGGGRQKIYLVDPVSGREELLIGGNAFSIEANPVFSPDGNYVLFDTDYTGIVNLYAYHLNEKKLFQITNVIGGAMMPAVSPDGRRIAYVSYSSRGYDIAVMDFNVSAWKDVHPSVTVTTPVSSFVERLTAETFSVHEYNPFPSLVPTFWTPYGYYDENGSQNSIYLGGFDPLQQHLYYINYGYDFDASRPSYAFYYANSQFLPQLSFSLSDLAVPYSWNGTAYWERQKERAASATFFDNRVFTEYDRQSFAVGLKNTNLSKITSIESLSPKPNFGNLNALFLAWRYRNDRSYAYSISPEDGLDVSGLAEVYSRDLRSDYAFTTYSASLKNYFKSPLKQQVLASKLNGFYSQGDQLQQGGFSWQYLQLRGYPSTSQRGNKGLSWSFEYRFPLGYPERGFLYGSTFLDRMWASLFFDAGGATFSSLGGLSVKRGVGAELNLGTSTLWGSYSFVLKLVYARGLDAGGENKTYFTLGL